MVPMTDKTPAPDTAPAPAQEEATTATTFLEEEVHSYAIVNRFTALESVETWETPEEAQEAANSLGGLPGEYGVTFRAQFRITTA